jgi:hypothetical protein
MAGYILLGTLAAIGLMSSLWVCFGWLLPGAKGGALVCVGWPDAGTVSRYRWLREIGMLHCPLLIGTEDAEAPEEERLCSCGIELCSPENLVLRLERERKNSDGTGNGDPSGRDQCRGISEL